MVDQDDRRGGCRRVEADDEPAGGPYRVGRHVGRTVYRQTGPDPSDIDELIGVMDTRELAALAVAAMNQAVRTGRPVTAAPVSGSYSQGEVDVLTAAIVEGWAVDITNRTSARTLARWLLDLGWRHTATPPEGADR